MYRSPPNHKRKGGDNMLTIKGTIVGRTEKVVEYVKNGVSTSFNSITLWISNGGKPLPVSAREGNKSKQGEKIELPVYIKPWKSKNGNSGFELKEANQGA
jgi:hypothetical protein